MASSLIHLSPFSFLRPIKFPTTPPLRLSKLTPNSTPTAISDHQFLRPIPANPRRKMAQLITPRANPAPDFAGSLSGAINLITSNPPNWQSALLANALIFLLGSPILVTGLSLPGIVAAFLLGSLTWRAFGGSGFFLVACYFVMGTAATKVKMAQKEAQGVAEKRKGRRGPASVIGSSAAGCVCAFLSINGIGGKAMSQLWWLGFVASFCTKLSDTVSSEIGKAYGKTTYLVTNFKVVPRGTEGAVSAEGTLAGLVAAVLLASIGCLTGQINATEAAICVLASQLANFGESVIGASIQDKEGFRWLNNDVVNIINISMGGLFAVMLQQILLCKSEAIRDGIRKSMWSSP